MTLWPCPRVIARPVSAMALELNSRGRDLLLAIRTLASASANPSSRAKTVTCARMDSTTSAVERLVPFLNSQFFYYL